MPTVSAAPEPPSPGGRNKQQQQQRLKLDGSSGVSGEGLQAGVTTITTSTSNAAISMSPEQEASPPPAAPGASPPPAPPAAGPTTTRLPSPHATHHHHHQHPHQVVLSSHHQQQPPQQPESYTSDVEQFSGRIVYNPDGSAYIIEDSDSEGESVAAAAASAAVAAAAVAVSNHQAQQYHPHQQQQQQQYQQQYQQQLAALHHHHQQQQQVAAAVAAAAAASNTQSTPAAPLQAVYVRQAAQPQQPPAVHSYRVVSLKDARPPRPASVPVKPILMCFVCKLSFGFARSFAGHAQAEHGVSLQEAEREVLAADCSAILQCVGADKRPVVSLLEPLGAGHHQVSGPGTPAAAAPSDLQQHQQQQQQQRVSPTSSEAGSRAPSVAPSATKSPSPPYGPPSAPGTPVATGAPPPPPPPAPYVTGTTIGVCPEHLQGRPSGAECARCELILASGRLGPAGLGNVHSRNSCKTLKCPKCNWHYKYQETLEIHMKEKHPEAETSCIYCIAGQPHPRLARGETYTCGYKPYRCEVCNYSTTTKGNLSIHMQSDKHLNNMQELQNGGAPPGAANPGAGPDASPSQRGNASPKGPTAMSHHLASPGAVAAAAAVAAATHHHHVGSAGKPKPSFRCDVCNYETNVARNLRIHMTSEKHTHNMLVLQQNVKHMQTLSALHQQQQQQQQQGAAGHHHQQQAAAQQQHLENLFGAAAAAAAAAGHHPALYAAAAAGLGDKPEAALADMAYNQALLIQMMTGGQLPGGHNAGGAPGELHAAAADLGLNPDTMEPPPEPADPDPERTFTCCVCNAFSTDSLEELGRHLAHDRTRLREQEILAVVAGHYVCKLCTYKTNLKANFQLHCKTDKHLQRLQHVNHVKEGGARNEWKLKYAAAPGGVQVRCNACDYYTNSAHKLQLHAAGARHDAGSSLLRHLADRAQRSSQPRVFHCALCGFAAPTRLPLLQHARSLKHLHLEQLHQLQRRADGRDGAPDLAEVFQVLGQPGSPEDYQQQGGQGSATPVPSSPGSERGRDQQRPGDDQDDSSSMSQQQSNHCGEQGGHVCPYCNYTSGSEMRMQAHVLAQHGNQQNSGSGVANSQQAGAGNAASPPAHFQCPLCQDSFRDRVGLERHVMQIHSVNAEGLQRLLMLVDQSHWLNQAARTPTPGTGSAEEGPAGNAGPGGGAGATDLMSPRSDESAECEAERCSACLRTFRNIDELCAHQNETGHLEVRQTAAGAGYVCWKKGCGLQFPAAQALQAHFRDAHAKNSVSHMSVSERHVYKYRCNQCSLAFKTLEKLQLHSQYHLIRDATRCVLCGRSFRSVVALHKHVEAAHAELTDEELAAYKHSLLNNPLLLAGLQGQVLDGAAAAQQQRSEGGDGAAAAGGGGEDDAGEVATSEDGTAGGAADENSDSDSGATGATYREQQFLEDYLNSQAVAEDGYGDPARKYKCHRCRVAFTRQSYLTAHNKTLLHRKGEKLSYPMEKYLDPNRPYKCDVCKESFTQKNILLVHYNSVSHLHKLKRAMQDQQTSGGGSSPALGLALGLAAAVANNNNNNNNGGGGSQQSAGSKTPGSGSTSPADDDDKKRYRCNICRVAYTQGSTLDIHMRSVLHQTRASKLQDLALAGQLDLSRPLIEQPDQQQQQRQSRPASPGLTSQQQDSTTTTTPTGCASAGQNKGCSPTPSPGPHQQTGLPGHQQGLAGCPKCGALFATHEQLSAHQQLYCMFSGSPPNASGASNNNNNNTISSGGSSMVAASEAARSPPPGEHDLAARLSLNLPRRSGSHMYKHLLESFGFDLVMQFNENHQRRQQLQLQQEQAAAVAAAAAHQQNQQYQHHQQLQHHQHQPESATTVSDSMAPSENNSAVPGATSQQQQQHQQQEEDAADGGSLLPEVSRSTCQHCNKEFSSVWVLKSHCEEIHKDLVPLEFLERYAQHFKTEYERKSVAAPATPEGAPSSSAAAEDEPKETLHAKLNLQTSPDVGASGGASTPTSGETNTGGGAIPAGLQALLAQNPMALAQQMSEMQAALNVMQLQQLNFGPMMQMMGMAGPMLGLNALAAMNLQPPLVPLMMPPPPYGDPMGQYGGPQDPQTMMAKQQQAAAAAMMQQQQQQAAASAAANQKRARTRITDDQLKILRAHFDINNSPSEEQIHEMAGQSGLPPKVIKHWFRNTLFKERQRNKDSPYNFNNPPSTTLNLEEYEKTGEAKVMQLNTSGEELSQQQPPQTPKQESEVPQQQHAESEPPVEIKTEPKEEPQYEEDKHQLQQQYHHHHQEDDKTGIVNFGMPPQSPAASLAGSEQPAHSPRPGTPAATGLTLTSIIASQLGDAVGASPMLPPPKLHPQGFASPGGVQAAMLALTPSRSLSPGPRGSAADYGCGGGANSNSSNSSAGSTGKRANRTRFTDYQIKVLQEFFENNAYPKDDDLEYLSKLLSLSPRVIVVWFQNARQKARKVYENQPAAEPAGVADEPGANRFQRTPGLNYQCKKCLLVFQRYYELIRHQKTHCFKEEDAKRSAQAQAAAAQIAAVLSSEDSNSSTTVEQGTAAAAAVAVAAAVQQAASHQNQQGQQPAQHSPGGTAQPGTPTSGAQTGNYPTSPADTPTPTADANAKDGTFQCDKCNLVFPRFELWREHQLVHLMNPNLFPSYPPDSPFGILQQHAQLQQQLAAGGLDLGMGGGGGGGGGSPASLHHQQQHNQQQQQHQQHPLAAMLAGAGVGAGKRKLDEYDGGESDVSDQPKDKRLRTTILPEQLDYLYQKYQLESNPSRKMLENIAHEVGLKKRVVQVWFQNTRARERKGQFRAHAQVINKRCPFCPALFKVKSALESHLATKHADQCSRGDINIDALPDEEVSLESAPSGAGSVGGQPNMMPPLFPPFHPDVESSIKKYYEESMKRYISELQAHAAASGSTGGSGGGGGGGGPTTNGERAGETPLDLSKPVDLSRPMRVSTELMMDAGAGPLTDLSERSLCDERSDSMSETTEFFDDESNPTSPASSTQSQGRCGGGQAGGGGPGSTPGSSSNKRFRTQMSSLQVKVMKSLFGDYKTPTMAECEMLGREIGLPKRVVQVWFQNARAKEKKTKLAMQKALGVGGEDATPRPPDDCRHCGFKYSHKYSVQDHIFTRAHIANVKAHLEGVARDAAASSSDAEFTVPVPPAPGGSACPPDSTTAPGGGGGATGNTTPGHLNNNNNAHLAQMQLLQMAGMQMAAAVKADKDDGQEALFQQLYALGGGAPFGAGNAANQFLHPAMFGGNVFEPTQCDFGQALASVAKTEPEDCF